MALSSAARSPPSSRRARGRRGRIRPQARSPAAPLAATVRARASATMRLLSHLRFERRKPALVGTVLGEQFVPRPHRGFVARAVMRVGRLEREHQPVEEAAALAGRAGEAGPSPGSPTAPPKARQHGRRGGSVDRTSRWARWRACRCRCRSRQHAPRLQRRRRRFAAPFRLARRREGAAARAATPLRGCWSCPRHSRR